MNARLSPPARSGLFEEAFHRLRHAPAPAWAAYLTGTVPWALGFLYFCADMSWHARASRRMVGLALVVAVLYVWMKTWQSVFAARLRQHILGQDPPGWTMLEAVRMTAGQALFQAVGLLLIPVSVVLVMPVPWVYAYFQAVTILGQGRDGSVARLAARAGREAARWPVQNLHFHSTASIFVGMVMLNLAVALIVLPMLAKSVLGIDSAVSRNPFVVVNSTFLLILFVLTYLLTDPVLKTFHVLRCIQGEALRTGEDLLARVRAVPVAAMCILLVALAPLPAGADDAPPAEVPAAAWTVDPAALEQAVQATLEHPRYAWRMPREEDPLLEGTLFAHWVEAVVARGTEWVQWIQGKIGDWQRWIRRMLRASERGPEEGAGDRWERILRIAAVAALAVSLGLLLWALVAGVRKRRSRATADTVAGPDVTAEELADEATTADRLPSARWIELAARMRAEGHLRLAMRALYLGMLAWLAEQRLVQVWAGKTNGQFVRELGVRRHALPGTCAALEQATRRFEAVWYGPHPATDQGYAELEHDLGVMQSHA